MVNITKEDSGVQSAMLTIEVGADDYQEKVNKVIKEYGRTIQLKGFRKGKVPPGIVRKMFGNQILADELNKIVNEELVNYLTENDIDILGRPLPKEGQQIDFNINEANPYQFEFELGLAPAFELKALNGKTSITSYKIEVADKVIDEEVERIQKRFGEMTHPEPPIEEDDVLYMEFKELEGSDLKPEGYETMTTIAYNMFKDEEVKKQVGAMKLNDTIDVELPNALDRAMDSVAKHVLSVPEEQQEGISHFWRLTFLEINRIEPAELNQDLFDKAFGKDEVDTETAMREKIKAEIEPYYQRYADQRLVNDIQEAILNSTDITLPEDFLKRFIKATNEEPPTDEELDNSFEGVSKSLKWDLIVNKIAKEQAITVEKEEVVETTKQQLRQQLAMYGQGDMPEEELKALAERYAMSEEQYKKTAENLMNDKIFMYLKSSLDLKPETISFEEFTKLNQSEA